MTSTGHCISRRESATPSGNPYRDLEKQAIGYGCDLPLSKRECEILAVIRYLDPLGYSGRYRFLSALPRDARRVYLDMRYQLGSPRLAEFVKFREALENRDWKKAAKEIRNSRYYHEAPNRAEANAKLLESISVP